MSKIIEVKKIVLEFLKENIQCHEISIVKLNKGAESWDAIAEVYEDDSFLKSMNLPPKKKRVFYTVKVDESNEVTAYERFTEYPATDD
jgi:hypothetical protein